MHSFSTLNKNNNPKQACCLVFIIWQSCFACSTLQGYSASVAHVQLSAQAKFIYQQLNSAHESVVTISPCPLFWSRPQWRHSQGKAGPTVPVGNCLASCFWPHPAKVRLKKQWPPNWLGPSTQKWLEKSCWRYFTQLYMSPENATSHCGSACAVCG